MRVKVKSPGRNLRNLWPGVPFFFHHEKLDSSKSGTASGTASATAGGERGAVGDDLSLQNCLLKE